MTSKFRFAKAGERRVDYVAVQQGGPKAKYGYAPDVRRYYRKLRQRGGFGAWEARDIVMSLLYTGTKSEFRFDHQDEENVA